MIFLLAQKVKIGGPGNQQDITGPLANINSLADLVNKVTQFLIPLASIILFFVLVFGGYQFLLSRGNPEKVKSAKAIITAGVIGFVLLILSFLIVKLISSILGVGEGIL